MIVDSMTYEEIISEFKKDWENYFPNVLPRFMNDSKYRRYMLKEAKDNVPVFFKPIELTSNRGNKYILQINSKGRSDYKRGGLMFLLLMYYHRPEGIYAVMRCPQSSWDLKEASYNIYIPHLFDRYRERELQDIHKPKMQTIIEFFKNNGVGRYIDVTNDKYDDNIFFTITNGVLLGGKLDDGNTLLRTYITFDMLRGEQIDDKERLIARVKEYIENEQ